MNVYYGFEHCFERGAVITVGSFDGVHSGHRRLIALLNREAHTTGRDAVVVTFEPHPRQVLRGDNRLLCTIEEKLLLLEEAGAQNVVVVEFTREFAAISGDVFAQELLKKRLGGEVIFVGEGHSFGRDKGGSVEVLRECGFTVMDIERFDLISSTKVREAIDAGDMELATELLGAPYLVVTPISNKTKLMPVKGCYRCSVGGVEGVLSVAEISSMESKYIIRVFGLS
ncbi:MAG: hypothetical protein R3Y49_06390 [Rikenellaceae bacterium]